MKLNLLSRAKWCAGAAALLLATASHANFLTNNNFEASPTTGWTNLPSVAGSALDITGDGFSGQGVSFVPVEDNKEESIKQTIALEPTAIYSFDFYAKLVGTPSLLVTFNGVSFLDLLDPTADPDDIRIAEKTSKDGWLYYSVLITGASGPLQFTFTGDTGDEAYIDEVGLSCGNQQDNLNCRAPTNNNDVPEPGSLLLVGAALAGLGLVRRRKQV